VQFVASAYFTHSSNDFKTRGAACKNTQNKHALLFVRKTIWAIINGR